MTAVIVVLLIAGALFAWYAHDMRRNHEREIQHVRDSYQSQAYGVAADIASTLAPLKKGQEAPVLRPKWGAMKDVQIGNLGDAYCVHLWSNESDRAHVYFDGKQWVAQRGCICE